MKIIIDSREQNPLKFRHKYVTDTIVQKLDVGDYCCEYSNGMISPVCFERKSISDLFSTLSSGYRRFKREIQRAEDNCKKLVLLIEGTVNKIKQGIPHSTRNGESVIRQLHTLQIKYGLDWYGCIDRDEMSYYIISFFLSLGYLRCKRK